MRIVILLFLSVFSFSLVAQCTFVLEKCSIAYKGEPFQPVPANTFWIKGKKDTVIVLFHNDSLFAFLEFKFQKDKKSDLGYFTIYQNLNVGKDTLTFCRGSYTELGHQGWGFDHAERQKDFCWKTTTETSGYSVITQALTINGYPVDTSATLINNLPHGTWKIRLYENVYSETSYKNGIKQGKEVEFDLKRNYYTERYFKDGKKDGSETTVFENGEKTKKIYKDDLLISGPDYFKKGGKKRKGIRLN